MSDFWNWWQNLPASIDPVIFQIGSFKVHYYGLMYLLAFGLTYFLSLYRIRTEDRWELTTESLQNLLTATVIGLIIGARLGYVVIYNFSYYLQHPLQIILPFDFSNGIKFTGISGMSYHGGLAGAILGGAWFVYRHKLSFRNMADLLIPCIPLGYTFGRLGNFINGELWGRKTTAVIGMYFPDAPGSALRHPSQLYEAFGEGIAVFIGLWLLRNKIRTPGAMLALYLIGYGVARFVIEFFRQPDAHIGFVISSFSMGQVLCSLMIVSGVALLVYFRSTALRQQTKPAKKSKNKKI